jgi:tetratricopeptide (TPR) repeat protein
VFLERLSQLVPTLPNDAVLHIHGLPFKFLKSTRSIPFVRTPGGLLDYSIKSWLDLNHPGNDMDVVLHKRHQVELPPTDVILNVTRGEGNTVEIDVVLEFSDVIDELGDYRDLGKSYVDIEDFRNAIGYLETYVDSVPDDYEGWALLGEAYSELDQKPLAEQHLRRSLELNKKDNRRAYSNLTTLLREERDFAEAEELCLEWIKQRPQDAAVSYRGIGWGYSSRGANRKAIEYFEKSLAIEKNTHTYWGLLMSYVDGLRDYKTAIRYAQEWAEFDQREANAYFMLGQAHYKLNHLPAAIKNFERSLELGQRRSTARYRTYQTLGEAKLQQGDVQGGLAVYVDGTVVFPDSADMMCRVADTQIRLGNCEEAREWLERAVETGLTRARETQTRGAIVQCEGRRR